MGKNKYFKKEFHNLFLNHEGNLDKTPSNVAFDEMTYCWSKSVSGNRNFFIFFKIEKKSY